MMKNKKVLMGVLIAILCLIIAGLIVYIIFTKKDDILNNKKENEKTNEVVNNEFGMSMEEQSKSILKQYYGLDYLYLYDYNNLARYPDAYKDALISFYGYVERVLEEKDNSYKLLCSIVDNYGNVSEEYIVVEGEYRKYRYLKNDFVAVYGVYKGNETYSVDGSNEVMPKVNAVKIVVGDAIGEFSEFDEDELREVAKEFFGTTFTLTKPFYDYSTELGAYLMSLPFHYIITLDNNSNARFNKYRIYPSGNRIEVATEEDNRYLHRYIVKSSDNKNFILSTYTSNNDFLELQLYDKDFKLIWSREFKNASNYIFDNNNGRIALAIDNELYLIDEKTGKNIVEPVITSNSSCIKLLANGDVILVMKSAKDFIYYIDANGNIKWKTSLSTYNGESSNKIDGIYSILVTNNKIYVGFYINSSNTHVAVFDEKGKELVNTFAHPKN